MKIVRTNAALAANGEEKQEHKTEQIHLNSTRKCKKKTGLRERKNVVIQRIERMIKHTSSLTLFCMMNESYLLLTHIMKE